MALRDRMAASLYRLWFENFLGVLALAKRNLDGSRTLSMEVVDNLRITGAKRWDNVPPLLQDEYLAMADRMMDTMFTPELIPVNERAWHHELFRQFRLDMGKTQTEIALILGVSKNTVSRWELGTGQVPGPVRQVVFMMSRPGSSCGETQQ